MMTSVFKRIYSRTFHTINVPDDVRAVTVCDHRREISPQAVGLSNEGANSIWSAVEALYKTGYYPTVLFCLRRRGEILFNRSIGHTMGNGPEDHDITEKVLASYRTPTCLFSGSKAITAMVMHKLAELGEIDLLCPVSYYLPEFARNGKEHITTYHLLTHRAGLPNVPGLKLMRDFYDQDSAFEKLCDAKPTVYSGHQQAYHAMTTGVVYEELIRRITGEDMRQFWRKWFKKPMNFKYFDYGADKSVRKKTTREYCTGIQDFLPLDFMMEKYLGSNLRESVDITNEDEFFEAIIPSGNMVATAEEVTAFYQMLLNHGEWQGTRVLGADTVAGAVTPVGPTVIDKAIFLPLRFSQGFVMGNDRIGMYGPNSGDAFGHLGWINNLMWADPKREISVAILVSGVPFVACNAPALVRLIGAIAKHCPTVKESSQVVEKLSA